MGFLRLRVLGLLAVVVLAQGLACGRIQSALVERGVDRLLEGNRRDWLDDDAMHVVLCGTGAPLLDLDRAGPCAAIVAGGRMYLVDTGPGSTERSLQYRLPLEKLEAVLLTHFHSDHIGELGEAMTQSWIAGRRSALDVYGPEGVVDVVDGFSKAYSLDQIYRTAHHGQKFMPKEAASMLAHPVRAASGEDAPVFEKHGLKVTAIAVDHAPVAPAVGYRFEYAGRTVVVSGDTRYSANLARASEGADLLVHEVLGTGLVGSMSRTLAERGAERLAKLVADVLDYHSSPADAVRVAREAGVQTLVFTHLVPPLPGFMARRVFLGKLGETAGVEVLLGEDGMHFRLPRTGAVERDSLD